MMLPIPSRAAVCCAGLMMSGCMQSMPNAEMITKPTQEAFTRLTSWAPWRPAPQPEPIILGNEVLSPPPTASSGVAAAVDMEPKPSERATLEPRIGLRGQIAPTLSQRRALQPVATASRRSPSARVIPVGDTLPVPGRVSCQTSSSVGERVRMECKPID